MGMFRKSVRCHVSHRPAGRTEKTVVPLNHRSVTSDGMEVTNVEYVEIDVSQSDLVKQIPDSDQYKLADLLKAGVPLQEIHTVGMIESEKPVFDINKAFDELKSIVELSK